MSRVGKIGPPPRHIWEDPDPATLPAFLRSQRAIPLVESPAIEDLKVASLGGYGTLEALRVFQILEDAGIPCCCCGVSALIYYGAGRVRHDWEICVPSERIHEAVSLMKSETLSKVFASVPPWPYIQPNSLAHTYSRFQAIGVDFYFVLVPSSDVHLTISPSSLQRSHNGLLYPKLHVLIQSFLETHDRVSLCDAIDGSDVSEEWGSENLDLEGTTDMEWAARMNRVFKESNSGPGFMGIVPSKPITKRELWSWAVTGKLGRLGWTRPADLFSTRFRLRGSPDPWLARHDCC